MRSGGANSVAWVAWCVHLNYARGLLTDEFAGRATSVAGLLKVGVSADQAAAILLVACLMVMPGLLLRHRLPVWFVLVLLLPQQLCLYLSAASCYNAMLVGVYASGVARPASFILTDQGIYLILAWAHTMAMVAVLLRSDNVTWSGVRGLFRR